MKLVLVALLLAGGNAVEWQKTLSEIVLIEEDAAALERIALLEQQLTDAGTVEAKARLGELLVRAKMPRQGMMSQGMTATKAIGLFEEVLKAEPENVDVLHLHARTCVAMPEMFGKRAAGVASLERLVAMAERTPGSVPHADVFVLLAKLKPDSAQATFEIARRAFPDDKRFRVADGAQPVAPDPAVAKDSKQRFRNALLANELDFATLDRGLAAGEALNPTDHEYPLFRGLLRLWRLEAVPGAREASEAVVLFRKALTINPNDTRIYGWLGPLLYISGHVSGQPQMVAEGEQLMAEGVEKNPEQNRFGRAFAHRVTNTKPEQIEDDLYRTMELCSGATMDHKRFLPGPVVRDHPACKDNKYAPFNLAGTLYWAGEFFAAREDAVRARDAYEAAMRADAKKDWPYRKLTEERLLILDGKDLPRTKNPASCMLCHQR